jgi:uncharacterized protein (TIGR02757 family)
MEKDLDVLVKKYEVKTFIKDDPIQFPHRYENSNDIEIAAFIASIFAYGNRVVFIKKLDELFNIMENKPFEYINTANFNQLKGFNYRFAKDFDILEVFNILHKLYVNDGGLKDLFYYGWKKEQAIYPMLQIVSDYFYSRIENAVGQGFYHLIPNPKNNGTMKRMNMFLRWMVRDGEVDLGLWKFIPKNKLLIPMDVHVARVSRELGFLSRKSNDYKAVIELTNNLCKLDCNDPIKYDFAMFGSGIDVF